MNHHDAGSAEIDPQALSSEVPSGSAARAGGPEWRQLSFRASGLTIELEITGSGDYRRLFGQLIPRQSAVVDVRHGHGVITVEADSLGRFSAEEVPFGQVSLRCRLGSDQSPVVTGWISLLGRCRLARLQPNLAPTPQRRFHRERRGRGPGTAPEIAPRTSLPNPLCAYRRGSSRWQPSGCHREISAPQPKRSARTRHRLCCSHGC